MLSKQHRLPLRTDLVQVKKRGKLFQGKLFSLLVRERNDSQPSRFGFIISAKIHKRAVRRNRAHRLLTEAIRPLLPKIKPGFDSVFLVKRKIIGKELSEIKESTERIFKKANLT
jgi:ribonuclease P protein component